MLKLVYLFLPLLLSVVGFLFYLGTNRTVMDANPHQSGSPQPELEYLKAVNSAAPLKDPERGISLNLSKR